MQNPIPMGARRPAKILGAVTSIVTASLGAYSAFDSPTAQAVALMAAALAVVGGAAYAWATRRMPSRVPRQ